MKWHPLYRSFILNLCSLFIILLPLAVFGQSNTQVTFRVNMSSVVTPNVGQLTNVWVGGNFNTTSNTYDLFDENGDNIYEATVSVPNQTLYFLFHYAVIYNNGFSWEAYESIPAECSVNGDRQVEIIGDSLEIYYCFNQCSSTCPIYPGCTDASACNYDPSGLVNFDDGSCIYPGDSCDDGNPNTYGDSIITAANGSCFCAGTLFDPGQIQSGQFCLTEGDFLPLGFGLQPSLNGNPNWDYQVGWYYQEGAIPCPDNNTSDLNGWTLAQQFEANEAVLIPVSFVGTRTYKCYILPNASSGIPAQWVNNCVIVNAYETPQIDIALSNSMCANGTANIVVSSDFFDVIQYTLNGTDFFESAFFTVDSSGVYQSQLTNSIIGCTIELEIPVNLTPSIDSLPICLVTVDAQTGNNQVVWQPFTSEYIHSYQILRETSINDAYEIVGEVQYGQDGLFSDTNSNSAVQSSNYKLAVLDSCGNTIKISDAHQTIHLTSNVGLNNTVNLIWSHYMGLEFGSYNIYRGTDITNLTLLASIGSELNSYTDINPLGGNAFYVIEVAGISCDPSRSELTSRSNLIQVLPGNVAESTSGDIRIFPNPIEEVFTLVSSEPMGSFYEITDATGRIILKGQLTGAQMDFDFSSRPNGVYFIRVKSETLVMIKQ